MVRSLWTLGMAAIVAMASWAGVAHADPAAGAPKIVRRTARVVKSSRCLAPAVEVIAGAETSALSLTRCDGTVLPRAVDALAQLAQPVHTNPTRSAGVPTRPAADAPAEPRIDARLVERLSQVVDHFHKDGVRSRIVLGLPGRGGHAAPLPEHALDFRIEGVSADALTTYCKTLPETGCARLSRSKTVRMQVHEDVDDAKPRTEPAPATNPAPTTSPAPGAARAPSELGKPAPGAFI